MVLGFSSIIFNRLKDAASLFLEWSLIPMGKENVSDRMVKWTPKALESVEQVRRLRPGAQEEGRKIGDKRTLYESRL
jgi:hypothetical protein